MKNPMHNIDDLFYKGVGDHTEFPADTLWNEIEAELDRDASLAIRKKYKRARRSAAALLVLLIGVAAYEVINYSNRSLEAQGSAIPAAVIDLTMPPVHSIDTKEERREFAGIKNGMLLNVRPGADETPAGNGEDNTIEGITMVEPNEESFMQTEIDEAEAGKETYLLPQLLPANDRDIHSSQSLRLGNDGVLPTLSLNDRDLAAPAIQLRLRKPSSNVKETGFYASAYFSPAFAWNKVTDESQPVSRRGGRGNNGSNNSNGSSANGSGNSNGGSNNGGTGGSTNGSNNGPGGNGWTRGGRSVYNNVAESERAKIAYGGGLKLGFQFNKNLAVETGVNYLEASSIADPKMVYAEKKSNGRVEYRVNCSSGYSYHVPGGSSAIAPGDSTIVSDSRNTVSYVGVPLNVRYRIFSAGKFRVTASAGGQVNLLVNSSAQTVFNHGTAHESKAISKTEGLKPNYFSALAGLEAEMQVTRNISLTLSPVAQFGLSNVNKENTIKTHSNYLSVAGGIKLKL